MPHKKRKRNYRPLVNDGRVGKQKRVKTPPVTLTTNVYKHLGLRRLPVTNRGRLLDRVDRSGFDEKFAAGDGNCQFRSLAKVFHQKQKHYDFVRSKIVQEMRANPKIYFDDGSYVYKWMTSRKAYDEYVKRMSQDGCWGDVVTLRAAANLYRVRILTFSSIKQEVMFEIYPSDKKYSKDVYLSYCLEESEGVDDGHHNAVFLRDGMHVDDGHYNAVFLKDEIPAEDPRESSPSDHPSSLSRLESYNYAIRLYVSNISDAATEEQLLAKFDEFKEEGEVIEASINYSKDGTSEGFGFVIVESETDATRMMKELNRKDFMGKKLHIQLASEVFSTYDYIAY